MSDKVRLHRGGDCEMVWHLHDLTPRPNVGEWHEVEIPEPPKPREPKVLHLREEGGRIVGHERTAHCLDCCLFRAVEIVPERVRRWAFTDPNDTETSDWLRLPEGWDK